MQKISETYEFVSIDDASHDFDADYVQALTLLRRGSEKYTALYCPEWDNLLITGDQYLSEREYQARATAAYCFLSVILK